MHDRVAGAQFATEAGWALAGLVAGGLAHGLRAAGGAAPGLPAAAWAAPGGRLRSAGAAAADGTSHGIGPVRPAWQARSPDPAPVAPRSGPCLPAPRTDRREQQRGVPSTT